MSGLDASVHQLPSAQPDFKILQEKLIHRRYLALYDRKIRLASAKGRQVSHDSQARSEGAAPQGKGFTSLKIMQGIAFDYDIVGHPQCDFHFSVTFPYHKRSKESPGMPCHSEVHPSFFKGVKQQFNGFQRFLQNKFAMSGRQGMLLSF